MRESIARFEAESDPLNLEPEIALLRSVVEDLANRWNEIYGPDGALLAWHNSFGSDSVDANPKPRHLPDFSSIAMVVDKIGKTAERVHKMRNEGMISMQTLNRVIEQMAMDMTTVVNETGMSQHKIDRFLEAVEGKWNSIRLDAGRGDKPRNP